MPTDIGGGIGSPPGEGEPKQTGGGLEAWAAALAAAQDISPEQAAARIRAYISEHPTSTPEAAARALNAGSVGDTTGSGSSSSGGSSGGSSSGGSTPAGPTPQQLRNAEASFTSILTGWGIPMKPAILDAVKQAAKNGVSTTAFIANFRKTKAYATRFAGILRPNGTMRMTEAQYIAGYQASRDAAAKLGLNFSQAAFGRAIKNGNSVSEIADKLQVEDQLKAYKPQLDEFNDYLQSTGQIKKPLAGKDLREFIMGYRKDLEGAWDVANTAFRLQEQAGVNVGKPGQGNDISYQELKGELARFKALGGDPSQIDFAKLGSLIGNVIPKSELYGVGITKRNLVGMMMNGKDAPEITARAQQVMDTYEAAVTEEGAQSQNQQGRVYQNVRSRPLGE